MSNTSVIILLIISCILIPIFTISKAKTSVNDNILDKSYSASLKGIFAVYIALGHLVLMSKPAHSILLPLQNLGYLCVAFFFLMSGYGLTLGYLKCGLTDFIQKRFLKIYIPYLISNLIVGFLYLMFMGDTKVSDIFIKSLLMRPIYSDEMLWYVFVQILMYIFFWISFKFFPQKKNNFYKFLALLVFTFAYIAFSKVTHASLWRYKTVLCFPLGVGIALYKDKVLTVIKRHYLKLITPAILLCIVGFASVNMNKHEFVMSVMSSVMFACLTVLVSYKFNIHSKILNFLGDISYEYYIFQLPVIYIVLKNIDSGIDYLYPIIIVISTTVLSFGAHRISDFICKQISSVIKKVGLKI